MRHVRIATRASKLAMTQSTHVRDMIATTCPNTEISFVHISTEGDRNKTDFLHKVDSVGFFTSEVENALLDNRACQPSRRRRSPCVQWLGGCYRGRSE